MIRSLLFALALAPLVALPLHAETRTWTSADGSKTVEAELVEVKDEKVTLRRADGKTVTVDIDSLSAEDQDFIYKAEAESAAPAAPDSASDAGIQVEFIGLEVGKPRPTVPEDEDADGFKIAEGVEGTLLRFWLHAPGRKMIAIDEAESKIVSLEDDQGTTLAEPTDDGPTKGFGMLGKLKKQLDANRLTFIPSAHMRTADLEIEVPTRPAVGARELSLAAQVVVKCGVDEQQADAPPAKLEEGAIFTTGDITWKVESVKPFERLGMKLRIVLTTDFAYEALARLECLDEEGDPIDSLEPAIMPTGSKMQAYLMLSDEVETLGLRATYFKKIETVTVPIKVTTGVGF